MRALYEDVRLPFEVGAPPVISVTTPAAEPAVAAAARTLAPTGTDTVAPALPEEDRGGQQAPAAPRRVA